MPHIPSANPADFAEQNPEKDPEYLHGMDRRRSFIPMAFQITSPFNSRKALLPHALVMHVNPASFSLTHTKRVERIQTRGGFIEQHWGDDLTDIQAEGSTGAFMNIYTGLSSILRQKTIAWDRYRDLHDLYRCNGSVFGPSGSIVLQGHVMLMFDRGTYIGFFESFEVEEADDKPFSFQVSWAFKVEEELVRIPGAFDSGESMGIDAHQEVG